MVGLTVEFARTEPSSALNGSLTKDGLKFMWERKEYPAVDAGFSSSEILKIDSSVV